MALPDAPPLPPLAPPKPHGTRPPTPSGSVPLLAAASVSSMLERFDERHKRLLAEAQQGAMQVLKEENRKLAEELVVCRRKEIKHMQNKTRQRTAPPLPMAPNSPSRREMARNKESEFLIDPWADPLPGSRKPQPTS